MVWIFALLVILLLGYFLLAKKSNAPPVVHYGIIPYLSTLIKYQQAPHELLKWAREKYGNTFTISVFGFINMTFVFSDEGLETFFKAKEEKLSLAEAARSLLSFLLDAAEDAAKNAQQNANKKIEWLREAITTESRLKLFYEKIEDEVQTHIAKWATLDKIPLVESITKLVVAINVRSFVSDEGVEFTDEITELYHIIEEKGTSAKAIFLPFSQDRREAVVAKERIAKIIAAIMKKRLEFVRNHPDEKPIDILQANIDAGLSAEQIAANLIAIFFAAHVNTVSTNIWSILHLAHNATWQQKLYEELKGLNTLDMEALKRTEILGNIIKETVRYHALMQIMRTAKQDLEVDGYVIPKGHLYMICPYLVHSDNIVYDKSSDWNPERFKAKNYGYRFIQWGFGAHRCLGEHYAYMVMRTLLAHVFSTYSVVPCQDNLPEPEYKKIMGMAPPCQEVYVSFKQK